MYLISNANYQGFPIYSSPAYLAFDILFQMFLNKSYISECS